MQGSATTGEAASARALLQAPQVVEVRELPGPRPATAAAMQYDDFFDEVAGVGLAVPVAAKEPGGWWNGLREEATAAATTMVKRVTQVEPKKAPKAGGAGRGSGIPTAIHVSDDAVTQLLQEAQDVLAARQEYGGHATAPEQMTASQLCQGLAGGALPGCK